MSGQSLYDDDILLWSEQQAAVIRRLRETSRGLPNELDIENVAEEIESVGRSELATVESFVELILLHLIKLAVGPDAEAAAHWQGEIAGFAANLERRYAPSMQQRIDMDKEWRSARRQATLAYGARGAERIAGLPSRCPISVADLLEEDLDIDGLTSCVRGGAGPSAATTA